MKEEKTEPIISGQPGYKPGKVRYGYASPNRARDMYNIAQSKLPDVSHLSKAHSPFAAFFRYEKARENGDDPESASVKASSNPNAHPPKAGQTDYGSYLFGVGYEDPSDDDGTEPTNWTSYTVGRFGIRLFSRGVMGATFFTLAARATGRMLSGYNHMAGFSEQKNGLQLVSKTFDTIFAPPIKAFAHMVAPVGKKEQYAHRIVWFRDKAEFGSRIFKDGKSVATDGRSLGAEMSAMTFDFAMASAGDAWGRQIASLFDPNQKISWYEDNHFDAQKFAKSVAWNAWDIFSLRQAEDWAAALPYVYQMRFQRQALNKIYPGFKLTADKALNGGAWQLNEQGDITASYAKAGMIDLQLRFTGYNWYTLMYRDAYRAVSDAIQTYHDHGNTLPSLHMPDDPAHAVLDGVADSFRYVAKSAVKAAIYMTPSVPFFWAIRVPQSKYKGMGVVIPDGADRSKGGYVLMPEGKNEFTFPRTNASFIGDGIAGHRELQGNETMRVGSLQRSQPFVSADMRKGFYPYDRAHVRGALDAALNPIGEACYKGGELLNRGFRAFGMNNKKMLAHDLVNASASYTPYMFAKTEAALHWDREGAYRVNLMDNAIYRLIDGVTSFNVGEIRGGFSDIREQIIHPATNVKAKDNQDRSPSDKTDQNQPSNKVAKVSHETDRIVHSEASKATDQNQSSREGKWASKIPVSTDISVPSNVTIH